MLSDEEWRYTWEHGRQLKTLSMGGETWTYTYDANGMRTSRSNGVVTYEYYYTGTQLSWMHYHHDENGIEVDLWLQFSYNTAGVPLGVTVHDGNLIAHYYYITNIQGDVIGIIDNSIDKDVTYVYDAWGNMIEPEDPYEDSIAAVNPLRYRGYIYDQETGLYYLQSRYYNPEIGRFINADDISYLGADNTPVSYNLFVYGSNNPVIYKDTSGNAVETVFDVISVGTSIAEVLINPADPWAWVGLAGDLVDLIPFVTGVGEATRAVKITVSLADGAGDVVSAARKSYNALKKLDDAKDYIKAVGSYEIIFESGYKYVGKGGFYRAITSATKRAADNFDVVASISWRSAPNSTWALIDEYARQLTNNFKAGGKLYNKIWSPGRSIVNAIRSII